MSSTPESAEAIGVTGVYDADHLDQAIQQAIIRPGKVFRVTHFFIDYLPTAMTSVIKKLLKAALHC